MQGYNCQSRADVCRVYLLLPGILRPKRRTCRRYVKELEWRSRRSFKQAVCLYIPQGKPKKEGVRNGSGSRRPNSFCEARGPQTVSVYALFKILEGRARRPYSGSAKRQVACYDRAIPCTFDKSLPRDPIWTCCIPTPRTASRTQPQYS
jgi:hypothetical protein